MQNLLPLLVCITCFILGSSSYRPHRYLEEIFANVSTLRGLTYDVKKDDTLKLDTYMPENDTMQRRPVILYIHGGGFGAGARDEALHIAFCEKMARRGYVAVSMSYYLTMKGQSFSCDQPAPNKLKTFDSAAEDIYAATRYLGKQAGRLRIDTTRIVLVGSSAGAEAALHAVYGYDKRNDRPAYAGVVSLAGAVVDTARINQATTIPTQLFHGTDDNLVPYATASHHYCKKADPGYLILHGPYSIVDRLKHLDQGYYLYTACGDGHEWASRPLAEHVDLIGDFVYQDVLHAKKRKIQTQVGEGCRGNYE